MNSQITNPRGELQVFDSFEEAEAAERLEWMSMSGEQKMRLLEGLRDSSSITSRQLKQDFEAFLQSLIEEDVRFLVVGGYAVAWHGRPRYTDDLDVWIERSEINAEKIVRALKGSSFNHPLVKKEHFCHGDEINSLGEPPMKIELFKSIPGVQFEDCYRRRVFWPLDEMQVPMISLPDLRENKKASGRQKDFADLAHYLPEPDESH